MRRVLALLAMTAGAAGAWAQPGTKTGIEYRVRPWGDTDPAHWVSTGTFENLESDDPISLEVGCFYYRSQGYGLASVVNSVYGSPFSAAEGDSVQLLDRPDSSLHPDGRLGRFNNGGQFQVLYHTGTAGVDANRFRIASTGNPNDVAAGGIAVRQGTPFANGTNFDAMDGVLAYHFRLTLARTAGPATRVITIDTPRPKVNSYRIYETSGSTSATNVTFEDTVPAVVTVRWCDAEVSIIQPPQSQVLVWGHTAAFHVDASGPNLTYKWRKGGQPLADDGRITGTESDTLTIGSSQCTDVGDYDCLVSAGCAPVSSGAASLLPPSIVVQQPPIDRPIFVGQAASFTVQAVGDSLRYQWRKNGSDLANGGRISGATAATLSIASATCADAGLYDCVISDPCASLACAPAHLTAGPLITLQPGGVWWLQTGMELEVGVPAGAPYQYRWRRNGQDLFNIPGLFSGVTTRKMTILSSDPSVPGEFECLVSDACGSTVSDPVTIVCPADFDKNSFVNGDDFDAFRAEFMLGNQSADIDQNGFVNGDDADYFYERFVAGC